MKNKYIQSVVLVALEKIDDLARDMSEKGKKTYYNELIDQLKGKL